VTLARRDTDKDGVVSLGQIEVQREARYNM
jgi:hypothetical protein